MLPALLFIFYFFVILFALAALARKKNIPISFKMLAIIYSYKIFFGCMYGFIFLRFYKGDDTWMFHNESQLQYQKMIHHPIEFVKDFLPYPAFRASQNFWQGIQFYIQDLEFYSMTKLLALFNIFSRGNYYINVLFFDFLAIIGLLVLYKLLYKFFANKKTSLIIILFFIPLTTFWLSGIRAEGLLLLFIAIIMYYSEKWFNEKKNGIYFFYIIIGLIGLVILRAQMLLVLMPAFVSTALSRKKNQKAIYYFVAVYVICFIFFIGSIFISPEKNLATQIATRQQEFFKLHANTSFKLDSLQPSVTSFAKIFPQAFSNTFLRPFLWEAKSALQIFTALDVILFWLLMTIAIFFHEKKWKQIINRPLLLLLLFYGISQIIFIGYVVPFPGAIVRYKSIPEIFLMIVIVCITDYDKISRFLNIQKKESQ